MVDRLVHSEANKRRLNGVENCFGISGAPLATPGRVLVGEGVLTKICRKKPKPRQFYLFNDIMVYGSIIINKKKYNRQHIIPLEEVNLQNLEDEGVLRNGWLIKTPNKSFAVFAATPTEKTEWMNHIEKCVEELCTRTGKQPTGEPAAVWVPDSDARTCMHCKKTQFTLLNRRHHCRGCGSVTCNSCSRNKFLIPAQSSKPVRVCDSCFSSLSRGRLSLGDALEGPIGLTPKDAAPVSAESPAKVESIKQGSEQLEKQSSVESSEDSDDDEEEDDLKVIDQMNKLEDEMGNVVIDEKPTFYSSSFNFEEIGSQEVSNSNSTDTEACSESKATATPDPKSV